MYERLITGSFIHSFRKGGGGEKGKHWYGKNSGIGFVKGEGKEEKDWLGKVEGRREGGKEEKRLKRKRKG